jgi:hypothetical protein
MAPEINNINGGLLIQGASYPIHEFGELLFFHIRTFGRVALGFGDNCRSLVRTTS